MSDRAKQAPATEKESSLRRCRWAQGGQGDQGDQGDLMVRYHDEEWGVPLHDDRRLFEFLILEGAQAGLSWETILKKRDHYRAAFDDFDAAKIARYQQRRVNRLLADPGIVRNRLKISAAIGNARAFLQVQEEFGTFDAFIWGFVDGKRRQNARRWGKPIPAQTRESEAMSKELVRRGFRFVGPTIWYAFMQAVGMVNDHAVECFRYGELRKER